MYQIGIAVRYLIGRERIAVLGDIARRSALAANACGLKLTAVATQRDRERDWVGIDWFEAVSVGMRRDGSVLLRGAAVARF